MRIVILSERSWRSAECPVWSKLEWSCWQGKDMGSSWWGPDSFSLGAKESWYFTMSSTLNCRLLPLQKKRGKVWLKSHSGAALYQYPSFVILESTGICCYLYISFPFIILIKDGFWTRKMSHLLWLGWAIIIILPVRINYCEK